MPARHQPGLIVDLFAGGGGASTGLEAALGRPVDIAINHDPVALAVHKRNHPRRRLFLVARSDGQPIRWPERLSLWTCPSVRRYRHVSTPAQGPGACDLLRLW